jgi:hypothetical protein
MLSRTAASSAGVSTTMFREKFRRLGRGHELEGVSPLSAITQSDRRTSRITVFVTPRTRAELERAARENERSLSAEARPAFRRHLSNGKEPTHE